MTFKIEGDIYKVGTTKKGGHFVNILVKSPDGSADSVCVFTDNGSYKIGTKYVGNVRAFVQMVSEVK